MKRQFSAGIVVYHTINKVRQYLLLHYASGHWDFPKGKIEKGESKYDAAARELKEETGLTAIFDEGFEHALHYYFKEKGELIYKTVYFYTGQSKEKDVTLSYEHIGYEWLPYEQALEQLTYNNAKDILKAVEHFLHSRK